MYGPISPPKRESVPRSTDPNQTGFSKEAVLIKWLVFASVLVLWVTLTEMHIANSPYFPSPTKVWRAFLRLLTPNSNDPTLGPLFAQGSFAVQTLYTLGRVYSAFFIGSFVGIVAGMYAGKSRLWDAAFRGVVNLIAVIPIIVLFVLFVITMYAIWPPLVLGTSGVIVFTTLVTLKFPANTAFEIVRDPEYDEYWEISKALGATKSQTLFLVVLPIAQAASIAALRPGLWTALGITCFSEWMIAPNGVGQMLQVMFQSMYWEGVFVVIFICFALAVPGFVVISLIRPATMRIIEAWFARG